MVVKLYGFPVSTATRRVAQILHEKRVPFEFIALDRGANEQKKPEHLARQPFGQVPVLASNLSHIKAHHHDLTKRMTMASLFMKAVPFAVILRPNGSIEGCC
jgi:hypothetical protein